MSSIIRPRSNRSVLLASAASVDNAIQDDGVKKGRKETSWHWRRLFRQFLEDEWKELQNFVTNLPILIMIGVSAGLIGFAFFHGIEWVTKIRENQPFFFFGLPFAGIVIHSLYRLAFRGKPFGTKAVIRRVQEKSIVSIRQVPLVFFSSLLTHLTGGSAGREGAVLEMGGAFGDKTASLIKISEKNHRVAILCGMAGAFSALFVTPLAAIFFVLEITDRRKIILRFFPLFISSMIAFSVVCALGHHPIYIPLYLPDPLPALPWLKCFALAGACGILGRFFCFIMKQTPILFQRILPNGYLRAAAGGTAVLTITYFLGTTQFNGLGTASIHAALTGHAGPFDFFWKLLLTAITLGAGFKGGEIIPAFFVGSAFGCVLGGAIGFLPDLGASAGLIALFSAVTKSPIAAFVLGVELFGPEGILFFALASAVGFFTSGKSSLYQ